MPSCHHCPPCCPSSPMLSIDPHADPCLLMPCICHYFVDPYILSCTTSPFIMSDQSPLFPVTLRISSVACPYTYCCRRSGPLHTTPSSPNSRCCVLAVPVGVPWPLPICPRAGLCPEVPSSSVPILLAPVLLCRPSSQPVWPVYLKMKGSPLLRH